MDFVGMADMDFDRMAAAENSAAADKGSVHRDFVDKDSADKGFAGKDSAHMELAVPAAVGIVPADLGFH